jgi:RNA polymerase sigma factor (sigma-70 family)
MEAVHNFSDQELVTNIRSGSRMEECIKTIYRNYFESLGWYVMNNNGTRQDAEDIFQEVVVSFIDLVQKDKFRGESTVKTFLFSLNRHLWLNELKRKGRALAREEKYEKGQERTTLDVSHLIVKKEDRNKVFELVSKLGDTCKKILVLFYYENRSITEILQSLHENPILKQTLKNILNG